MNQNSKITQFLDVRKQNRELNKPKSNKTQLKKNIQKHPTTTKQHLTIADYNIQNERLLKSAAFKTEKIEENQLKTLVNKNKKGSFNIINYYNGIKVSPYFDKPDEGYLVSEINKLTNTSFNEYCDIMEKHAKNICESVKKDDIIDLSRTKKVQFSNNDQFLLSQQRRARQQEVKSPVNVNIEPSIAERPFSPNLRRKYKKNPQIETKITEPLSLLYDWTIKQH
eukprot:TRINITY_DN905_c0_g1_i1.p1 TRINITY_DN905_c0_g1~~TRINITY_DN905_c0_g1_i1.p1  ORF type:complete len:234 (-),score=58.93 TRINITY_DN905_c0_g1_i1:143-814(-)